MYLPQTNYSEWRQWQRRYSLAQHFMGDQKVVEIKREMYGVRDITDMSPREVELVVIKCREVWCGERQNAG